MPEKEMHVVAKNNEGKMIDFFVYDLQGTLFAELKNECKRPLSYSQGLQKELMFTVFSTVTKKLQRQI
jgi:type VI protein secretion system component Hcp